MEYPNGLISLLAYGAPDVYLHGNPTRSIFKESYDRVTNSSFTFMETEFVQDDNNKTLYIATIPHEQDLIGKCYLEFHVECSDNIKGNNFFDVFQMVNKIACEIDGQDMETLFGSTLEILANDKRSNYPDISDDNIVIVPIPFFFTKSTSVYLPAQPNIKIKCEMKPGFIIDQVKFRYQAVYLDTNERKELYSNRSEYLVTLTSTITQTVVIPEGQDKYVVNLPYSHPVKDLRVMVKSSNAIKSFNIRLNGHLHMSVSESFARTIIPRQFYGIQDNTSNIYYIPFCHDPCAHKELQTSQIHFGRIDRAQLEIFVKPGEYTITIMAQYFNIINGYKGRLCLMYAQ